MSTKSDAELDIAKVVAFWMTEAEEALEVADHLIAKADYSYALFFGHLAVEKALKAPAPQNWTLMRRLRRN